MLWSITLFKISYETYLILLYLSTTGKVISFPQNIFALSQYSLLDFLTNLSYKDNSYVTFIIFLWNWNIFALNS